MKVYFSLPTIEGLKKLLVFFLFFGNLGAILVLWSLHSRYYILNPSGGQIYVALGRLTGLIAEFLILIQLVLIGRVRWFEHLFGFDRLNFVHRWIGYSLLIFLFAHPILLILGNAESNAVSFYNQFGDYLANKSYVILAFLSLCLFVYIVFLSISIVRKKLRYETWYFAHLFTYLAIVLAIPHQFNTGDFREGWPVYYWLILIFSVFAIVLFYRLLRPILRFIYHDFKIAKVVTESPDVVSLYLTGRNLKNFHFEAGQYANLTILGKGFWFTHPFSFSASYNGEYLRFTIKNSGDFTSKIPQVKVGTPVIVDGPLGLFVARRATREKYLFIAGGIGVTPLRAMLEALMQKKADIVLLYAVKTEKDLVFKAELETAKQVNPGLATHFILSTPAPGAGFESGHLDKEKIVRLVPDFFSREVFLCGPPGMMKAMVGELKSIGFESEHIHYEKFSF